MSLNNLRSFCSMLAREFIYDFRDQKLRGTDIDWNKNNSESINLVKNIPKYLFNVDQKELIVNRFLL